MELKKIEQSAGKIGIGHYFTLERIYVKPEEIMLDPRNPRLSVMSEDYEHLRDVEIVKSELQRTVLSQISKKEHHLKELEEDIRFRGFIDGLGSFIVKDVPGTNKLLVLEGNRRTAAIKRLLESPNTITEHVRSSISEVAVSRFVYKQNNTYSEAQIVEMLLGIIHLKGPQPWGNLEKSSYIYQAYMREFAEGNGSNKFEYDLDVIEKLCRVFPLKSADVRNNLRVYVVYRQLVKAGYDVEQDRYSLMELATCDKLLRKEYFQVNGNTLKFKDIGLDRIYKLCIHPNRPINDPPTFRKFKEIFKYGGNGSVEPIERGTSSVLEVYAKIKEDIDQGKMSEQLERILSQIRKLSIGAMSEADEECYELIEQIVKVVNSKLARIVDYVDDEPDEIDIYEDIEWPTNAQEALDMRDVDLRQFVIKTLIECPNSSCVRDTITTKVLKFMEVVTRGDPRRWFEMKVNDVLKEMIYDGLVEEYGTATNERIRLPR